MNQDDEDLFVIRFHSSKIRDRDEWEGDTGVHPIIYIPDGRKKQSLIPKVASAVSKVMRAAKTWPAVIIFALIVFAYCFHLYINYIKTVHNERRDHGNTSDR